MECKLMLQNLSRFHNIIIIIGCVLSSLII